MAVQSGQGESHRNWEHDQHTVLDTRPCYVRYSLRGLGAFSGGLCLLFGILNLFFHPLTVVCWPFSISQALIGFFVATNEATGGSVRVCHCIFLNNFPSCSNWIDKQPVWIKPLFYIISPLFGMIFCTTLWTFFGGGMVVLTGVAYAISLWRHDTSSPTSTSTSNDSPAFTNNNVGNPHPNPHPPTATATTTATFTSASSPSSKVFHSNSNQNPAISRPSPTIIDVRQANAAAKSPTTPLSSLANYEKNNEGGNYRYENISGISGPSNPNPNQRPTTLNMEMTSRQSPNSYYSNVDLDNDTGGAYPSGAYTDNPFVVSNSKSNNFRRDNDHEEFNC